MADDQIKKNEIKAEDAKSNLLNRVKLFASLAMVAGSLASIPAANASVPSGTSIGDRVAKVRQTLEEKSDKQALGAPLNLKDGDVLLAQWGNQWANWNNWDNWHNWYNWGNWGNWGNF